LFSVRKDKGFWLRLGGTLLTLALMVLLFRQQGWQEISGAFQRISGWRLAAAMLLMLLSRVAITFRWHVLLRSADEPVSLRQSLRLTFAGLFASNFLPTTIGGDVVRLAGAVQLRMDAAVSTASLVADRLVGMTGMIIALPWGLLRVAQVGLPALVAPSSWLPVLLVGTVLEGWPRRLWDTLLRFARKTLANFTLWTRRPRALGLSLLFTGVHMLCFFTSIWILLDGMKEPISWLRVAGIWSLIYFITLVPVSINGYGLQEVSTTLLYSRLGGISTEAAVTIALLVRTVQMIASLPGAVFVPGILAAQRDKPASQQT
jgi:uncharacterized membrane protein YbhN (UPF0104 family)